MNFTRRTRYFGTLFSVVNLVALTVLVGLGVRDALPLGLVGAVIVEAVGGWLAWRASSDIRG